VVLVVAAGDGLVDPDPDWLPVPATVIAADSGVDVARRLGWTVDVVVGDLDSVSAPALEGAIGAGAVLERHPRTKDHTDLELALARALALRPAEIVVVAGDGGRHDHVLGNALVLSGPRCAGVRMRAWLGSARVTVVRPQHPAVVTGRVGELVSLLPVHGTAAGVRTTGLAYALHGEELEAGTGRGLSNVLVAPPAEVSLGSGTLLVVVPGVLSGDAG
jgi:thiamine pyrophosphokinase